MHIMRRIFTYLFAALLFAFCVFSEDLIPQNISYGLLSSVQRNVIKDKKELYEDMKAVVQNGLIKIEVYSASGELVGTIEKPEDFTRDLEIRFSAQDLSIKTITTLQTLSIP